MNTYLSTGIKAFYHNFLLPLFGRSGPKQNSTGKMFDLNTGKTTLLILFSFLILGFNHKPEQDSVIFSIGNLDQKATEFALSGGNYHDFLKHDFGWEDQYYLVGKSNAKTDWPYIIPGPEDQWGGTGGTSGIRTHVMNILFGIKELPENGKWKLKISILDAASNFESLLKIKVNETVFKKKLNSGEGIIDLNKKADPAKTQQLEFELDSKILKTGGNEISIGIIEGSWIIFDAIQLEGTSEIVLNDNSNASAFIRNVKAANYELPDSKAQALLIDTEHLKNTPKLKVKLDGNTIFETILEKGRSVFEAPMPAVTGNPVKSNYTVEIDGNEVEKGTVVRSPQPKVTPADYVDTQLGTAHSRWMIAPGPWMPFGMVKLSPDNQNAGWQAGYQPSLESIGCFSHIHEWTMGGLGMLPVNGKLKIANGDESMDFIKDKTKPQKLQTLESYRSRIDKSTEKTPLGYYSVVLSDYNIKAELTATTRCGMQRYTFPKGTDSRVMIDLQIPTEYNYNILEAQIKQVSSRRIEGYSKQQSPDAWSGGINQDYTIYFVLEFDQDIKKFGGWENKTLSENRTIEGQNLEDVGSYVEFDTTQNQVVQCRSSISYVDLAGAGNNLQKEITEPFNWDFEAVRKAQVKAWNEILNRVQISSTDKREKVRFYTNLYRSFCRNIFSDVDGRWTDATEKTQQFKDKEAVALGCDAFWNTFWNLNQVWNLVTPEWSSKWVKSQLGMYDANKWLAKGPAGMEYIPVMVAEHEIPLLVSAYQMGIRDYDSEKMFEAIKKMQTTLPAKVGGGFAGNEDLAVYLKYHYVPSDKGRFSNSLEYSFDDWTVGQLALKMNKKQDYKIFNDRGNWWKNVIEPKEGYAQLKNSEGKWEENFDPFKSGANHHYVEGNAWQLTFFVPQNIPELAKIIGKDKFIKRLDWGFEVSEPWRYNAPGDQYWDFPVVQGNQQSMHFAFLYNWVGEPWKTQKWSQSILDRYYGHETGNAYLGDEDQGQMSAWFVMASIGLFQIDGGASATPVYEITSPLFAKTTLDLGHQYGRGKTFTIEAKNISRKNCYIQSAKLNGKPLNSFKFPAGELLKGGSLILEMGANPNKKWGIK